MSFPSQWIAPAKGLSQSSHPIDGFIKNALSDTSTIRIQTNVMSHVEFSTIVWDETQEGYPTIQSGES